MGLVTPTPGLRSSDTQRLLYDPNGYYDAVHAVKLFEII